MFIIFIMWSIHKIFIKTLYKLLYYNTSLISIIVNVILQ